MSGVKHSDTESQQGALCNSMAINEQPGPRRVLTPALIVCSLTLSPINHTLAGQVYKSVDIDGNVTYSSIPPQDAIQTERVNISVKASPNTQDNSNIERIKHLAEKLEKDRIQRRDDRTAAREKRDSARAKKKAEQAKKQAVETPDRYYPVYVPRHPHHPVKSGGPKPEHRLH